MPVALALAAATLAFGADPLAPVLVHDRDERVFAASVAASDLPVPGRPAARRGAVAYRHVSEAPRGGTWRQYWFFYADNRQDRGILRTGRHLGDWELVQFRLDARGRPIEAVYAQHSGAERCPWAAVERRSGHPVIYVANASHAAYLRPGLRDRTWPDPNDEADGRGAVARPAVQDIEETAPPWMAWPGRWGPTRRGLVPGEQDSPRGPAHQPDRWDAAGFAAAARRCRAGCDRPGECDRAETAMTAGAIAGVALIAALVIRRRRRGGGDGRPARHPLGYG